MALADSRSLKNAYSLLMVKSFLIWTFTLTVCLLVIGFPLIVLMATIGALLAVTLQSVMPMSAVLLVAGSIIGANLLAIAVGSAALTFKGVHPQEVGWLRWLHGEENPNHTSIYASCPLTCSVKH
jgi:hypothetical protein